MTTAHDKSVAAVVAAIQRTNGTATVEHHADGSSTVHAAGSTRRAEIGKRGAIKWTGARAKWGGGNASIARRISA